MLDLVKSDEQAEVAKVFAYVRERAVGFDNAAETIDEFLRSIAFEQSDAEDAK